MSMIKIVPADSDVLGVQNISLIKRAAAGLIGEDRRELEKRASSEIFKDINKVLEKVAKDETLIHLIAMGTTEASGVNRNGDGFSERTCERYHPTFVKHAKFYRAHRNKDPEKSYGHIVKSAFNKPMQRIELLVALNGTPAAAKRNKGLVADKELEKLASGKDIPVSMACLLPFDTCSYCGNKAPRVADYCDSLSHGGHCKAGGLKHNIGQLVEVDGDVHHLHADNPDPKFFDISHVFRPADRIAYVTGELQKTAAHQIVKSAEIAIALGLVAPVDLLLADRHILAEDAPLIKLAHQLVALEDTWQQQPPQEFAVYAPALSPQLDEYQDDLSPLPGGREKVSSTLRALADFGVCLPPERFVELFTSIGREKAASVGYSIRQQLPGIYSRMLSRGDLAARVKSSGFLPTGKPSVGEVKWASTLADAYGLRSRDVARRSSLAAMLQVPQPSFVQKAAASAVAQQDLAEQYALYKLAFLSAFPQTNSDSLLTTSLALMQNYSN